MPRVARIASLAAALFAAGCASDASNGQVPDNDSSAPTTTEHAATTASAPDTSTSAASPNAAPSPATASGGTCLMFYHCGCNVGCSKVASPRDELRDGLEVQIVSGINAGSKVFVAASKDKTGREVFSLTHHKPGAPMPCATPAARQLMAYPCDAARSGDLDAHGCDSGCE